MRRRRKNPIPKRLLPHKVKYKKYLGNTGEGDTWAEECTLTFVKVEENKQLHITQNGREIIGNARLFYDFVNSTGLSEKPVENSKIIFNDRTYIIKSTDSLCDNSDIPHHYEILLT